MKKIFVLTAFMLPLLAFGQKKKLVWSDEFNYTGHPDPKKWRYEEGFVRHRELQYYTKNRLENAKVANGNLIITAIKENPNVLIRDKKKGGEFKFVTSNSGGAYTSASLNTEDKYSFRYGRVEVRAKLPHGRGVWPAIWTLRTDLGWGPGDSVNVYSEIDIMEFVGHDPNAIHANIHPGLTGGGSRGGQITFENPSADFHIYAIEWHEDHIDFFFDDKKYFTYSRQDISPGAKWAYDTPHYLLINLAIGGEWGGEQGVDESIFPMEYLVDYVRIYELK